MVRPRFSRRRFLQTTALAFAGAPCIGRSAARQGFEIGLVADAQYADVEAKGTRHYRRSLAKLAAAVEFLDSRPLAFCVHLGDLIDREWRSFDDILRPLGASRHRWHQLLGNHDFDVQDRQKPEVPARLGMAWRHGSFTHQGFRFVILDTNAVSTYAHPAGSPERAGAELELARLEAAGVRQAKPWNGGLGLAQLEWFERECAAARAAAQRVIVFSHHPVFPDNVHNAWDAGAALAAVDRHPNVAAWFNGHNHAGAFGQRLGVPYLTLQGMVETADTTAFATVRLLPDRILLTGHGRVPSRELALRPG